ncbi:MAG TPA: hypothetical protein VNI79_06035 [Sphingomicrobium sp.]|nr:hypothetical protein [Sphingomicrobium sp.]
MRTFSMFAAAAAVVATSSVPAVMASATAHATGQSHVHQLKSGRTHYARKYCRRSDGTYGLIAGGVGGAVVGREVIGKGILGTGAGIVGGALAGRAVDRTITAGSRCYWR